MELTLTTDPVTIDELMTNVAFSNEVLYCKTETEAEERAAKVLAMEARFGRVETTATVQAAGKFRPRGMKFLVTVVRNGR